MFVALDRSTRLMVQNATQINLLFTRDADTPLLLQGVFVQITSSLFASPHLHCTTENSKLRLPRAKDSIIQR